MVCKGRHWSTTKESMVQCSAYHGTRQIRDAQPGWEQLHSFLLLHTVHLITVGRWTPFAQQTMGSGSSSKAFTAKWLNKLSAGAGRRGRRAPHFPPSHYSGCKAGAAPRAATSPFVPAPWGSRTKPKRYHYQEQQHLNPPQQGRGRWGASGGRGGRGRQRRKRLSGKGGEQKKGAHRQQCPAPWQPAARVHLLKLSWVYGCL